MTRRLVVEADGGSRGNPGPAAYGTVVRDADTHEVLAERAEGLGRVTNNVAEYRGLIAGLTAARSVVEQVGDVAAIVVQMDSKLVVEQMSGRWKVKHPDMVPLAKEASALLRALPPTTFRWIPREQNKHADRLANEAMDAQATGHNWDGETVAALPLGPVQLATADAASADAASADPPAADAPAAVVASPGWNAVSTQPLTTLLLRHGQTPLSVQKRFSGRGDPELTELGRAQAADAAIRIGDLVDGGVAVSRLISSPLRRARETAAVVGARLGLPVEIEERLVETDFGAWEGYTFAEVKQRWPQEMTAWLASPDVAAPAGESFAATAERVQAVRDDWLAAGPGVILAVSHVTPIKCFVQLGLAASAQVLYRLHLDLCGLSTVDWYADGPAAVRGWNSLT